MIIDSSTLILLAKTGLLDKLLKRVKDKPKITAAIEQESTEKKNTFEAKIIKKRIEEGKILVKKIENLLFYRQLTEDFNLGKGEAEAVMLSKEEKDVLLTDDKKALNACKVFNLEFTTALNILVELYKEKELNKEESKTMLKKLIMYGRYSDELIKKAEDDLK